MSDAALETEAFNYRPELLQVAETVARDKGIERDEVLDAMEEAIQNAIDISDKGSVILLSPSSSSYDQFNGFEHRGDTFIDAVAELTDEILV